MKRCPLCFIEPLWKYNHRTSLVRKVGIQSLICNCRYCEPFAKRAQNTLQSDKAKWENRWGLFAGRLFREYTAQWTMPKRIHFWNRVCDPTRSAYTLDGSTPARSTAGRALTQMELAENKTLEGYDNDAKPSTKLFTL